MSSTLKAMAAATAKAADVKKPKTLCTRTTVECMIVFLLEERGYLCAISSTAFGGTYVAVVNRQIGRGEVSLWLAWRGDVHG